HERPPSETSSAFHHLTATLDHHHLLCRISSRRHRFLHSFPTRRSSDLNSRIGSRSTGCPAKWTGMTPRVRGVTRRSISSGSMLRDRKSTRLNSSHVSISYAVFCLKKKTQWYHLARQGFCRCCDHVVCLD